MILGTFRQEAEFHERQPEALKSKLAQERPLDLSPLRSDSSHDGQVRARSHKRRPKALKGELENFRKPGPCQETGIVTA
jgi:hypothetical protein